MSLHYLLVHVSRRFQKASKSALRVWFLEEVKYFKVRISSNFDALLFGGLPTMFQKTRHDQTFLIKSMASARDGLAQQSDEPLVLALYKNGSGSCSHMSVGRRIGDSDLGNNHIIVPYQTVLMSLCNSFAGLQNRTKWFGMVRHANA